MNDPSETLADPLFAITLRVFALERLIVGLAATMPELHTIVQKLPDPKFPGAEFLGRRFAGSAQAGVLMEQKFRESWRDLLSRIDKTYLENVEQ